MPCSKQYLYSISSSAPCAGVRARRNSENRVGKREKAVDARHLLEVKKADPIWRFARSDFCQNTSRARAPRKMAVALPGVPGQITWASGPKRMWSAMAIS
jgi:hypothetical protein